ncbi:MAG: hypothetical protein HOQ29_15815 [Acidobacteria bacterium]|nr:hypothetical protein [Acidobacteriota bacterium]
MGIVAGVVGSALGAWWLTAQRRARGRQSQAPERGTVIFDNTPVPADVDAII